MKDSTILRAIAMLAICAAGAVNGGAQTYGAAGTPTTVTNATGTITQLNYGNNGDVQGFLIGTNTLLSFHANIFGGLGALGVVGNAVTYSGTAFTATSGFESVHVSSFTNNITNATYTAPTSTSTAYGPTSGAIKQLNYSGNGSVDGFLFTPSGGSSSIFVSIGGRSSTTLTSLLTAGATVSVTGTTSARMAACSSTAALETVDASSLVIGSQTIVIGGGRPFGPGGPGGFGGPGGPGGQR
jgi:YD repeat-containing protein